jgi:hypothetical protein
MRNLARQSENGRARIDVLHQSADPREQSLALTMAAQKAPEPDPRVLNRSMRLFFRQVEG